MLPHELRSARRYVQRKKGIENAITVGLEMRERGEKLAGIRIDSGDLAWLSRYARERLDAAGLTDCGIVLSNDLDEYTIESIREQGANVMSWGVGTKLATAYDQPALGGVYKLSATKSQGDSKWKARLKVTEMSSKLTLPGVLDVRRFFFEDGRIAGDMVFDVNEPVSAEDKIIDPSDLLRQKSLAGLASETLLRPLSRDGKSVLAAEDRCAMAAQVRAKEALRKLDESQKRLLNPHTYPVGLEEGDVASPCGARGGASWPKNRLVRILVSTRARNNKAASGLMLRCRLLHCGDVSVRSA